MGNCEQGREFEIQMPLPMAFYFDPEKMVFVVGSGDSQQTFDPAKISGFHEIGIKTVDSRVRFDYQAEECFVLGHFKLIQLGFLRKKLAEIFSDNEKREMVNKEVIAVMRKVYKRLAPEIKLPRQRGGGGNILFNCGFNEKGVFALQTFGDCACLGRDPMNDINCSVSNMAEDISLPLVYGLHNADTKAKIMSLYAGAGTLAWIVKSSTS